MGGQIELQPYKGARDFYPEAMYFRHYWERTLEKVALRYGYEPYDGPILERVEIYQAKTSEEIVSQQTYAFMDRGGRHVVIRPEMTPTFARMVAAKAGSLVYPLRWFSIPNFWRYERPQKGRLREHWQLNCDLVAPDITPAYEAEMLKMIVDMMRDFGATKKMFTIKVNHRGLMDRLFERRFFVTNPVDRASLFYLIDRIHKVKYAALLEMAKYRSISRDLLEAVLDHIGQHPAPETFFADISDDPACRHFISLLSLASSLGVSPFLTFDPSIVRGFQYYTGLVFELVDIASRNPRSLLGGGRYDNLVAAFSNRQLQGIGFGMGDVTFRDFLEAHKLVKPSDYVPCRPYVVLVSEEAAAYAQTFVDAIRQAGYVARVIYAPDQQLFKTGIKSAYKHDPAFVVIAGQKEAQENSVTIRDVSAKKESIITGADFAGWLSQHVAR